jgi:hypothetical protein
MVENKLSLDQIIYEEESICDSSLDEPSSNGIASRIEGTPKNKNKSILPIVEDINVTEK